MKVKSLHIYPVKSCRRVDLGRGEIVDTGFVNDRRWMLVDENGVFLTQRKFPKMALIRAEARERLELSFADQSFALPLYTEEFGQRTVKVWESECLARDYGDPVAEALSDFLGAPVRLVTMDKDETRAITSSKAMQKDVLSFADGFPFLLTNQASLDELNRRLPEPIPMTRFRPNIVIEGAEAFAEDRWKKIRIGRAEFFLPKACVRCNITAVDQETGRRHPTEPLKTLAEFRMEDRKILFGQNLQHDHASGRTVAVGDAVEVLE